MIIFRMDNHVTAQPHPLPMAINKVVLASFVFPIAYAERFKELMPHAEGPHIFANAAHFLQDDRGPDLAAAAVDFLNRTFGGTR